MTPIRLRHVLALLLPPAVLSSISSPAAPQDPSSTNPSFALEARVSPETGLVGQPFEFHLTLTNRASGPATLLLEGCPVHFRIDGAWSPGGDCGETGEEIEVGSGQSLTFGPEQEPDLRFRPQDFPIGPGRHRVVLAIQGVGAAEAAFEVAEVDPRRAHLGGRVVGGDGAPVRDGTVALSRGFIELPESGDPEVVVGRTSPQGYFLLADLEPGRYLLRVHAGGRARWYPGVSDPLLASRVVLEAGEYRGDLAFTLPDRDLYPIEGTVTEVRGGQGGLPLADAVVVAVPLWLSGGDPAPGGDPGRAKGLRSTTSAADGRFRLELPEGMYRLAAGKPGSHRYQYWNQVAALGKADGLRLPSREPAPEVRFALGVLKDAALAVLEGQVLAGDPLRDAPPHPVARAEITALPLLPSSGADVVPTRTRADRHGFFRMEVPADSPYLVLAGAEGHRPRYHRHASGPRGAAWLDVAPGATADALRFLLQPEAASPAAIEGTAYRRLPGEECGSSRPERCLVPAAGAVVRATPAFPSPVPLEVRSEVNRDGSFRISGLFADPGTRLAYRVSVVGEGGSLVYHPEGVPFSHSETVPVDPGKTSRVDRIVFPGPERPLLEGFVGGWITDPDGEPLEGARVRVFLDPDRPDGRVVEGETDGQGYFLARDLPPGEPVLVAAAAEGRIPAYYPGVWRWQDAERVLAGGPDSRVPAVRIALEPAGGPGRGIQMGRVLGPVPGRLVGPAPAFYVRDACFYLEDATASGPGHAVPVAGGLTGDNGTLVLGDLPAGTYFARADRPGFEPSGFVADGEDRPTPIYLDADSPSRIVDITLRRLGGEEHGGPGKDGPELVTRLANVPNPFRPATSIRYTLEAPLRVSVHIFDYRGRMVRTLVDDAFQEPGPHRVQWDGRREDGSRVSSGVYFYRIEAGPERAARKMVLLP